MRERDYDCEKRYKSVRKMKTYCTCGIKRTREFKKIDDIKSQYIYTIFMDSV